MYTFKNILSFKNYLTQRGSNLCLALFARAEPVHFVELVQRFSRFPAVVKNQGKITVHLHQTGYVSAGQLGHFAQGIDTCNRDTIR